MLKPANIPKLIEYGAHDAGFSGLDWVHESEAEVESLLDTGLLPVRIVSAAPTGAKPFDGGQRRPIVVASEYERITRTYMEQKGLAWRYVRTFGATEVFSTRRCGHDRRQHGHWFRPGGEPVGSS